MGTYEDLKAAIQQVIRTNGNNEITGALLQQTLLSIVNSVGANAAFAGIATPNTVPGTADQNIFYIATTPGIYVNFNNIEVSENESAVLTNKSGQWNKSVLSLATQEQVTRMKIVHDFIDSMAIISNEGEERQGIAINYTDGSVIANDAYSTRIINFEANTLVVLNAITYNVYAAISKYENGAYKPIIKGLNLGAYSGYVVFHVAESGQYALTYNSFTAHEIRKVSGDITTIERALGYNIVELYNILNDEIIKNSAILSNIQELDKAAFVLGDNQYDASKQTPDTISPHYYVNGFPYSSTIYDTSFNATALIPIFEKTQYTLGLVPAFGSTVKPWSDAAEGVFFYDIKGNYIGETTDITFITPENAAYLRFNYNIGGGISLNLINQRVMLVFGSELPTEWKPYNKTAVSSIVKLLQDDFYTTANVETEADIVIQGYYIQSNGSLAVLGSMNAECWRVQTGDVFNLSVNGGVGVARAYAIYSTDEPSIETLISNNVIIVGHSIGDGNYNDKIIIPTGGRTLVVTYFNGFTSYSVTKQQQISLTERVNRLELDKFGKTCVKFDENGEDLYIAYLGDNSHEYCYHFKKCMANELYTFHRVGYRIVARQYADTENIPNWNGIVTMNYAGSDNIGPIAMVTGGWVGGNHHYPDEDAAAHNIYKTAKTDSFTITVDGLMISPGEKRFAENIIVNVINTIFDPIGVPESGDILTIPLSTESVQYRIKGNSIEVSVREQFVTTTTNKISTYYGMQSVFVNETEVITPLGEFIDWVAQSGEKQFTKQNYPNFNRFIEKNGNAGYYQSAYLLPNKNGTHNLLADGGGIFIASGGKCYHHIAGSESDVSQAPAGKSIVWSGVYSWFVAPFIDNEDVFVYRGMIHGKDAIFINTKKACNVNIPIPADMSLRKMSVVEQSDNITTTNEFTDIDGIQINASGSGSFIIVLE